MILRLLAGFAALALLLAACGDDTPDPTAVDTTPTVPDEPVAPGDDVDDGEIDDIFAQGPRGPARVTFEALDEGESMEWLTISYDPPRTAIISDEFRLVDDGEGTVTMCVAGGCQAQPGEQGQAMMMGMLGPFGFLHQALVDGEFAQTPGLVVDTYDDTIAGRSASCLRIQAGAWAPEAEQDGHVESCVDVDTGVALRWIFFDGDGIQSGMEVVEFGEPREEDFATE